MDDGEVSRAPAGRMQNLFKNNRNVFEAALKTKVAPYAWGKEVTPGLFAVETVGRTPGHTSDASHSPRNDGNILTPTGCGLIAAPMINAATIIIARRRTSAV
jgi:hypothetical protein